MLKTKEILSKKISNMLLALSCITVEANFGCLFLNSHSHENNFNFAPERTFRAQ